MQGCNICGATTYGETSGITEMTAFLVFVDLEKPYDSAPRQEVWRCTRENGVPYTYVMIVQDV